MAIDVRIEDHSEEFLRELDAKIPVALEMCGLVAEGYAKRLCPVGTPESTGKPGYIGGTLRNSIAHATSGKKASIDSYKDNSGEVRGGYTGTVPDDEGGKKAVYIGTNVEYAPYVEMGTSRTHAQPFLRPAVQDHVQQYKQIIEDALK